MQQYFKKAIKWCKNNRGEKQLKLTHKPWRSIKTKNQALRGCIGE
jgi:hypothetical protein